jgi:hypothetical protein
MTKMDELIHFWLSNVNYTSPYHPNDMARLYKVIHHGYKRVKNFSSVKLREKIEAHGHHFDEDDLDNLMDTTYKMLAFCQTNFPKPPSREQIEYNRAYFRGDL